MGVIFWIWIYCSLSLLFISCSSARVSHPRGTTTQQWNTSSEILQLELANSKEETKVENNEKEEVILQVDKRM